MNWLYQTNAQTYHIHDNGSRPFKAVIMGNNVEIFKQIENDDELIYETFPRYIFRTREIFVGKSPLNKWTEFSGGHGYKFDGNSLLLHLGFNVYVFVGWEIFSFRALSPIVEFVSIVGNNDVLESDVSSGLGSFSLFREKDVLESQILCDLGSFFSTKSQKDVPYPYAVDDKHNIYLLIENVVLRHHDKLFQQMSSYDNPYAYYYHYKLITDELGCFPPKKTIVPDFNGIREFYLGTDQYMLKYNPNPYKEYDRLVSHFDPYIWYLDSDGVRHTFTKEKFIDLMKAYGKYHNFEPIKERCQYYTRME